MNFPDRSLHILKKKVKGGHVPETFTVGNLETRSKTPDSLPSSATSSCARAWQLRVQPLPEQHLAALYFHSSVEITVHISASRYRLNFSTVQSTCKGVDSYGITSKPLSEKGDLTKRQMWMSQWCGIFKMWFPCLQSHEIVSGLLSSNKPLKKIPSIIYFREVLLQRTVTGLSLKFCYIYMFQKREKNHTEQKFSCKCIYYFWDFFNAEKLISSVGLQPCFIVYVKMRQEHPSTSFWSEESNGGLGYLCTHLTDSRVYYICTQSENVPQKTLQRVRTFAILTPLVHWKATCIHRENTYSGYEHQVLKIHITDCYNNKMQISLLIWTTSCDTNRNSSSPIP